MLHHVKPAWGEIIKMINLSFQKLSKTHSKRTKNIIRCACEKRKEKLPLFISYIQNSPKKLSKTHANKIHNMERKFLISLIHLFQTKPTKKSVKIHTKPTKIRKKMNKTKIHTVERKTLDLFDPPVSNKIHQKNC
jgi:hypothetical protein